MSTTDRAPHVPAMTTRLQHMPHTGEWVVRVRIDGKRHPDGDYFTDSKDDAIATARAIVATYNETHPRPPLVLAIEEDIMPATLAALSAAKECPTIEAAATLLRARLPGNFVYVGGRHVALHVNPTSPRLALITE